MLTIWMGLKMENNINKNKDKKVVLNMFTQPIIYRQATAYIDNDFYQYILNMNFGKPQTKQRKEFYHNIVSYLFFKTQTMRILHSALATNVSIYNSYLQKIFFQLDPNLKDELCDNFKSKYECELPSYDDLLNIYHLFYDIDQFLLIKDTESLQVPLLKNDIYNKFTFQCFEDLPFKQQPNLYYMLWIYYIDTFWAIFDKETNYPDFTITTGKDELDMNDINHQNLISTTLKQHLSEQISDYLNEIPENFEFLYKKLEKLTEEWILNERIFKLVDQNTPIFKYEQIKDKHKRIQKKRSR